MEADEIEGQDFEYSDRHPDDWVIGGSFRDAGFRSWDEAEKWARAKYGARFKGRVNGENEWRWAFLIKGPRGVGN